MSKLKVALKRPFNWNASTYYRALVPFMTLSKMDLADLYIDTGYRDQTIEDIAMACSHADVFLDYQRADSGWEQIQDANRTRGSYTRSDGTWGCAPIMVMDTDDDLFNVSPLNPAFDKLGTRINGVELKPKQFVGSVDVDGTKRPLFVDGKNGFSIVSNLETMRQFRKNLAISDLVVCSTPRSEAYVKREVPMANTVVIPNCVDFNDYPYVELAEHPEEVRILWQGSTTHHECLYPLIESIVRIAEKYPQTKWIFWGADYKWLTSRLPKDRVKIEEWCDYPEYKLRLSMMNFDIALAPLAPITFNQSRSAIKAYEPAALTRPVMTVAQRTGAFEDELVDGETALLFNTPEEFEAQLEKAILSPDLRTTIAANMRQWLVDNRDPKIWAKVLYEHLNKLVETRKALVGPPKAANDLSIQQPDVWAGEDAGRGSGGEAADPGVSGEGGPSNPVCDPNVESAELEVDGPGNDLPHVSRDCPVPSSA